MQKTSVEYDIRNVAVGPDGAIAAWALGREGTQRTRSFKKRSRSYPERAELIKADRRLARPNRGERRLEERPVEFQRRSDHDGAGAASAMRGAPLLSFWKRRAIGQYGAEGRRQRFGIAGRHETPVPPSSISSGRARRSSRRSGLRRAKLPG